LQEEARDLEEGNEMGVLHPPSETEANPLHQGHLTRPVSTKLKGRDASL
jgi:hypothetical protein